MVPVARLAALFVVFGLALSALQISALRLSHPRIPFPCVVIDNPPDGENADIPLKDVSVDVEMIDSIAKVSLVQTYKNDRSAPVHVSYVFPLDDSAAITSFLAEFPNGRKLIGVSKEKATAREEFDEAVAAGHTAVLLDQEASDVFKAEIGNLAANEEVKITIAYITQVPQENSQTFRFTLPTVIAPRYRASTSQPSITHAELPYSLTFDMSLSMTGAIESISSPTHEIRSTLSSTPSSAHTTTGTTPGYQQSTAKVYLQGNLDGDFVVVVRLAEAPKESSIIVEVDNSQPDATAIALNLKPLDFIRLPPAALNDGLIELTFVVDVSGSMNGDKMEDTKRAMQAAMQQLRDEKRGIFFNVIPFSSHYAPLFPDAQPLTEDTYQRAMKLIDGMQAGGGTEIYEPLEYTISRPLAANRHRRIIVLTDGLVGNTQQIFQLVKAHSSTTKVFSVGIGNGVSHALVNGLATHGLGVAEYVVLGEQVSDKMARQLARALSANSHNLEISFLGHDGSPITEGIIQSPSQLPPLYSESDVRALILVPKSVKSIIVKVAETSFSREFLLSNYRQVRSDIIHKMAAKAQIRDLELLLESDELMAGKEEEMNDVRKRIALIATNYNLMSSQTSFVAIDPDSVQSIKPVQVSVPTMPERGSFAKTGGYMRHMAAMPAMASNSYGGVVRDGVVRMMEMSDPNVRSQVMEMPKIDLSDLEDDSAASVPLPTPEIDDTTTASNDTEEASAFGWIGTLLELIFNIIFEILA